MDDLISIIVPVYNVEKYLKRCIDSILAQTYQNIEVLLIDDGSPDDSGNICDGYTLIDSRVRVFHKENGGVSSARNLGLKEAKGDYIGFVDADDYIDSSMYEVLLNNLKNENADISVCSYYQEDNEGVFQKHWAKDEYRIINKDEQIKCLISNQYYTCSCCDRIIKKQLIKDVVFDESIKHYEDYLFLYSAIKKSAKTVFDSKSLYFYCNNLQSAARKPFDKKKMDIVYVCGDVLEDIHKTYPQLYSCAKVEYVRINLLCSSLIAASNGDNKAEIKQLQRNIRHYMPWYLFTYASRGYKLHAVCVFISWRLYLYIIHHKTIGGNNAED